MGKKHTRNRPALRLNREGLRVLASSELEQVIGGLNGKHCQEQQRGGTRYCLE